MFIQVFVFRFFFFLANWNMLVHFAMKSIKLKVIVDDGKNTMVTQVANHICPDMKIGPHFIIKHFLKLLLWAHSAFLQEDGNNTTDLFPKQDSKCPERTL